MKTIHDYPLEIKFSLPPVLSSGDKVAIDTEIFNMDKNRLHRPVKLDGSPNGKFACATFCFDGETVYFVTDEHDVQQAMDNVSEAVWIFHNAKFDLTHLRRYAHIPKRLKRIWDTMLLEQIKFSGWYDKFALDDLVRRYLHCYLPKEERGGFQDAIELNDELIQYSAYDCIATWKVYQEQKPQVTKNELNLWANVELPFLWTIMGMSGIKLDLEKWTKLAESNKAKADEFQNKYPDILLSSPKQVKEELHRQKQKVDSTGAAVLQKIADKCEFAKDVLDFRIYSKRASTYGLKFIEKYVEHDGKIYSDIFQIGAITGRTSSRNPNQQNQINEHAYRECYIADTEDDVLCVADWGSQEPRFAAYFSQDQRLIDALNSPEKLYIRIARDALGIEVSKHDKEYTYIKSTILGIFYGMSAYGLAQRIGVSQDEAAEMIRKIIETYPGIGDYMMRQIGNIYSTSPEYCKFPKEGYVKGVLGRKIWLNPYDWGWPRLALNAPIQNSASEAMKIAAYKVCETWDEDFYDSTPLKLLVHDELGMGINNVGKESMLRILDEVMVSVSEKLHKGINAVADVGCACSWADAKV